MRALLVVNPKATATSPATRDVLARALGSELKVDVAETTSRGHATTLAHEAALDGVDLVVALGGDGTVNEVVNGLLADGPSVDLPALAVVPGGSANVFARVLDLPADPVEATADILAKLRDGRRRVVSLGRADDRWFTFCAGLGVDAEVVRAVEQRRAAGRRATPRLYFATTLRHYLLHTERRRPALTLEVPAGTAGPGETVERLHFAIVSNTAPWTYLGRRPVDPSPLASFDTGLDLFALRTMRTVTSLRHARQILAGRGRLPHGRHLVARHDLPGFTLRADRPMAAQVDGDYLGERDGMTLTAVPHALAVIA